MGNAVAEEISLRGKFNIEPGRYLAIIERKAAIAEMTARIGGIIGNGSAKEIEALGEYGRVLGTLGNIRHEFVDVFEREELENRVKNECLPLPILYAFQNKAVKRKIIPILKEGTLTRENTFEIAQTVMTTKQVQELKVLMTQLANRAMNALDFIENPEIVNKLVP